MSTEQAKPGLEPLANVPATKHYTRETHDREWLVIDADGQSVGRLATLIATLLKGKHKPTYTRHDDVGDFVVVINAAGVQFRGNEKASKKKYYKHTPWFGHLKERTAAEMLERNPELVLQKAVYGMLPHGALCNRLMKKLKIYPGADHPHKAQKPRPYTLPGADK